MDDAEKHTPLKWEAPAAVARSLFKADIFEAEGVQRLVAEIYGCGPVEARTRAERFTRAVNSYDAMRKALEPFVRFREAQRHLGGNTPKTGALYSVSTVGGEAEITVENLEAACAALALSRGEG